MKAIDRRRFLAWMGVAGVSAGFGVHGRSAQAADLSGITLNVSTYKTAYTQFMSAAGLADTPYKVNPVFVTFDVALRSISAGNIDLGVNFTDIPLTIWGENLSGAKVVAVAQNVIVGKALAVMIPEASTLTSAAQLRGKRVGYLKASNQHYFLLKLLDQQGLSFSDIVPVALPKDMGAPAFMSGQLDAWITQGPDTILAQQRFGGRVLATAGEEYAGNSIVCASVKALDDPLRFAAVSDYLQRADQTLRWIQANPQKWAALSSEWTGIDAAVYLEQARQVDGQDLRLFASSEVFIREQQGAADYLRGKGVIAREVDVRGLWDGRLGGVLGVKAG